MRNNWIRTAYTKLAANRDKSVLGAGTGERGGPAVPEFAEHTAAHAGAGAPWRMNSVLKQRLLSVALVLPVFLACLLWLPSPAWAALTGIPLSLAAFEWAKLGGYRYQKTLFPGLILGSCAMLYAWKGLHAEVAAELIVACLLLSLLFWTTVVPLWLRYGWSCSKRFLHAGVGWIVLVPTWLALVELQTTPWTLLMILLVVWIADTAAYFAGKRFGRNKMAPSISPGKTWEGAGGAFLVIALYVGLLGLMPQANPTSLGLPALMLWFFVLTAFSIIGDLFESWIKRLAAVKDSGTLLPGHGGILDRIDGLTSTLPFAALCLGLRIFQS
jgi:phosphatidate cytidylyltransferase